MLTELQSLWRKWNQVASLSGGTGAGGGDDGDDEKEKKDPFENDFTRFTSSRRRSDSGEKKDKADDKDKDKADDKDKLKVEGKSKDKPAETERIEGSDEAGPDWSTNSRRRTADNLRNFMNSAGAGGSGGYVGQVQLPSLKIPRPGRRGIILIVLGVLLVALVIVGPMILNFLADLLWFNELGQTEVLWTRTLAPLIIFVIGFLIAFIVIMINVSVARRFGPTGPVIQAAPNNPLAAFIGGEVRVLNTLFVIAAVIISLILGGAASSQWNTILFYLNAAPWPEKETIFNNSIGFYIFDVPFISFLQGWIVGLFIVCLIASMAIYFLRYSLAGRSFVFTRAIKTHASVLGAVILGLFALGYQISNWNLVYSTRGRTVGASATDVNAQVPANTILTVIVIIAAVALLTNIFIRDIRRGVTLLVAVSVIWIVAHILITIAFPSLYQNFSVKPNELSQEQPYIANNIKMTREAFGLQEGTDLAVNNFGGTAQLTQQDVQTNTYIQNNARLWDYDKLQQIYDTTQTLRRYYEFRDIDIDRYNLALNGSTATTETQVLLSARQLNLNNLPTKSWPSLHLQYTHGYGVQASPVNQVDTSGSPINLVTQNFPISSTILPVTQPRIYYGEGDGVSQGEADYSIVGTNQSEIDFPAGGATTDDNGAKFAYDGKGGIKLDNFFVKLAYSLKLSDFNLLISGSISDTSKLIFRRTISERLQQLAPFLIPDADPYLVIADGRLFWMQDAYTDTDLFPHSTPHTGTNTSYNYIRNSIKMVMDAYDGTTTFYLMDKPSVDPLAQTYANIYPGLFKPFSQMPAELQAHIRYPEDLFNIQTQVYETYHVTDPSQFYNNENLWQLPVDPRTSVSGRQASQFEPYYLVTQLPGQTHSEFVLINVFQPQNKVNLVSWMAARMDGDHYGQLVTYNFNQSVNIDGPAQFYSKLQALPDFSRQQSLLNTGSSQLPPGTIIIIPVDNSLLYVMPYYLQGSSTALPQLQFIATGANEKVYVSQPGSDDDRTKLLPTALLDVFTRGEQVAVSPGGNTGNTPPNTTPGATVVAQPTAASQPLTTPLSSGSVASGPTIGPSQSASVAELVRSIKAHQDLAAQAFKSGDTTTGNNEINAANSDLARLNQLLGR